MHMFKQLALIICCTTTVACCSEDQANMHSAKIETGMKELNSKYHDIKELMQRSNTQQQEFCKQMHTALKKTSKSWPLSAKLVALCLSGFIAWEHKDLFTKDNAHALWQEKESILRTLKYSIGSAYHQIEETVTQRLNKMKQKNEDTPKSE